MSFLLSITPADPKKGGGKRDKRKTEKSIITYLLVGLWALLIAFGAISAANPAWLAKISDPGKKVEARSKKDYGDLCLRKGDYNTAVSQYLAALDIIPDLIDVTVNLAVTYGQMGLNDRAIATLEDALTQNPEQPHVIYYNLAEVFNNSGRTADAMTYYNKAAQTAPFPIYSYRKLGQMYINRSDWDSAIYAFQKALDNKIGMRAAYEGMLKRDVHSFEERHETRDAIRAALDKGVSQDDLERYDNTVFVNLLKHEKDLSRLHDYIGYAYAMKGDILNSIPHLKIALNIWPENESARNNLNAAMQDERNG
ncbi:MAG: tetratricopeptide repeat protein [Victivallales bacterium]|nr:tetratricopeptide repeat protein [Victivallales bacterium]